jgi:hypothetical protein
VIESSASRSNITYTTGAKARIYAAPCVAVQNFESKIEPGHLQMLCDLYLQAESE